MKQKKIYPKSDLSLEDLEELLTELSKQGKFTRKPFSMTFYGTPEQNEKAIKQFDDAIKKHRL